LEDDGVPVLRADLGEQFLFVVRVFEQG